MDLNGNTATVCRHEGKGAPCSMALDIFYYFIASQRAVTSNQHGPDLGAEVSLPSQALWFPIIHSAPSVSHRPCSALLLQDPVIHFTQFLTRVCINLPWLQLRNLQHMATVTVSVESSHDCFWDS